MGRVSEEGTVLKNVLTGRREVCIRDLSGRVACKGADVEKGRTARIALELLNLPSSRTSPGLVSIGKNKQGYEEYWRGQDGALVVKVPKGEFLMGSAEREGETNERPQRRVLVSEFLMDKTEVTWRQFRLFAKATGAPLPPAPLWGTPGDYAVSGVRFDEAKAYCEWVGGRLPTEAEWEKGARGPDGRKYLWGNDWEPGRCNTFDGGPHRPEAVGSFPDCLSPYGLLDMSGGVFEWCSDWYADNYVGKSLQDPKGPETGRLRVLRGGSWLYQPLWVRTAYRHRNDPSGRNVHHGFRCVQSVPRKVLIGIGAKFAQGESSAAYGTVSVSSDLDGADLLLDGGVVDSVSAGHETTLNNVLMGDREVSVRDPSGREIKRVVRVEEDRTVLVALNRPQPEANRSLARLGKNPQGYQEYRREIDGAVVVRIPAGEFLMGNKRTERQPLEHRVYLSEFLMDKTAVTWAQFKKFAQASGTPLPPHLPYWGVHDDHPAVFVTWDEAKAYCEWAGGRLPTEAEREKAARGTDGRMYPWGNEEPTPERAVYRRSWGYVATDPVGAHPSGASPYGLLDMGGNVWEWCADWYDDKYYAASPVRNPQGPPTGQAHVVRGGSWDSRPAVLSASCRNWGHRGYREGDFGFRCAMDPENL